ncbi:HNH endonuclease family protein [Streptomyces griseoaurantiacus]|uniref:HNH endonuclease family protein n=1 Tax=Streptomyces griseoaurantiacus TaxID=68213 RepID=UPI0037A5BFB6
MAAHPLRRGRPCRRDEGLGLLPGAPHGLPSDDEELQPALPGTTQGAQGQGRPGGGGRLPAAAGRRLRPRDHDIRYVCRSQPLYKHLTRARLRLVLAELEATLYSGKTERIVHDGELTIEHLLPQSWEAHWPLPEDDGRGSVEAHQRREALVHTLGNLTLLTGKLNPAVSNGPWEHKRTEILRHSALSLNRSLAERWDEGTILARADHLTEAFCRRWRRLEGGAPALPAASLPGSFGATAQPHTPADGPATLKVPQARRDVALHMREAFAGLPVGSVLTVAQIAAAATSQYEAGEISAGAVTARLHSDNVPGLRAVPGSSPLSARKIT